MLILKLELPQDQRAQLSSGLVGTVNGWALEFRLKLCYHWVEFKSRYNQQLEPFQLSLVSEKY